MPVGLRAHRPELTMPTVLTQFGPGRVDKRDKSWRALITLSSTVGAYRREDDLDVPDPQD